MNKRGYKYEVIFSLILLGIMVLVGLVYGATYLAKNVCVSSSAQPQAEKSAATTPVAIPAVQPTIRTTFYTDEPTISEVPVGSSVKTSDGKTWTRVESSSGYNWQSKDDQEIFKSWSDLPAGSKSLQTDILTGAKNFITLTGSKLNAQSISKFFSNTLDYGKEALGFNTHPERWKWLTYFIIGFLAGLWVMAARYALGLFDVFAGKKGSENASKSSLAIWSGARGGLLVFITAFAYMTLMNLPVINKILQTITLTIFLPIFASGGRLYCDNMLLESFWIAIIIGLIPGLISYYMGFSRKVKNEKAANDAAAGVAINIGETKAAQAAESKKT